MTAADAGSAGAYPSSGEWFNQRRWDQPYATIRDSRGPERVETGDPDPTFKPRPVGFTASTSEPEPLLWDGDGA